MASGARKQGPAACICSSFGIRAVTRWRKLQGVPQRDTPKASGDWADKMNKDPLQPYQLKHLTLRNRIITTAHEPAYSEEGLPKDRYRLYHVERARGGSPSP